jgi:hypothetical protein
MKDLKSVRVIRYLRKYQTYGTTFENHYHAHGNLGGATFIFDLDYVQRTVSVSFSICADDENFNKELGIKTAIECGVERTMDLDGFRKLADDTGGFVDAYWNVVQASQALGTLSKREKVLLKKVDYQAWR